ncbi:FliO/MopB family protein [Simplicispira psychrophila]|uniref:FliO/MopB family protein n=1 Tax=Simplicispira psychrophila TaxID=80882 RepID=UPI000565F6AF|nr:flagellar biosynthetic protein FliO [Simplicispira psychrophila]
MTQTLLVVVLFIGAVALLPWLIRYIQQRQIKAAGATGMSSRVLSAVAVGPHQRIVTVEVGPEHARTCLVLGVTAQQINCLHVMAASSVITGADADSSFSHQMALAQTAPPAPGAVSHG